MIRLFAPVLLLLFCLRGGLALAHGLESDGIRVHEVYTGQRLGSIAKRYNVSIDAICRANDISRSAPIQPGQKLLIPSREDKDGSQAQRARRSGETSLNERLEESSGAGESKQASSSRKKKRSAKHKPRVHIVYSGQRLGSIAKRYNVSVDALCRANAIRRGAPIRPKQKLYIPWRQDKDGSQTLAWRLDRASGSDSDGRARSGRSRRGRGSWTAFVKAPKHRGYVEFIGHSGKWKGYVIGRNQQVLGKARREISRVLTAPASRQKVNSRLIQLLAEVSDTFGGRPLRIISGYRTTSFVKGSRHKLGRAVDFRIPGVPNEVLRDYLRQFEDVGVGYYPNSTFVHFDVRNRSAYWVDYAGPGEAPKLAPRSAQAKPSSLSP